MKKFPDHIKRWFYFLFTVTGIASGSHACAQCGPVISSFPYHEDFETTAGGWVSGGAGDDWAWGVPAKPLISGAGSGSKCWITGGTATSFYNFSERSYVESPCFDFSTLTNPYITLRVFWETEFTYDGANLQYSLDGGLSWANAGGYGDAVDCMNDNWYNYASVYNLQSLAAVKHGWCGNMQPSGGGCVGGSGSGGWVLARHTMPYLAGESSVKLRIAFGAGTTCNSYDGFAFDDITIKNAAPAITVNSVLHPAGCVFNNGSALLTVNGGVLPYFFTWNPNVSTTNAAAGLGAGNYTITITDAAGCSKINSITIGHTPAVSLAVAAVPDTCGRNVGAASVFANGGTPPFSYWWNPAGNTSALINNLSEGSYNVTVTDSQGCAATAQVDIDNTGAFTISLGNDTTFCETGFVLSPGSFAHYEWQDFSADSVFNVTAAGSYSVEVTAGNGCRAADTLEVIEDCLHDIILPNAFSPNDDGMNDVFKAEAVRVKSFEMNMYDRWGNIVFAANSVSQSWNGFFKNKKCSPGIYFYLVTYSVDDNEAMEKKGTVLLVR